MSSGSSSSSSSSGCGSSKPTNKNHSRKRNYSSSATLLPYKNSVLSTPSLTDQSSSSNSSSDTLYTLDHTLNNDESNTKNTKKRRSHQRPVPEVFTTTTHHQVITDQMTTITTTTMNIPSRTPSQRNVPAFLHKLFNMVEDPATTQLIRWSKSGNSFLVEGHEEFAKSVLPRFYKHNTFASFVRQLNMYDFHKIPHIQQGVLVTANPENEVWEFSNPNFQRDRPDLLVLVTRKRNRDRDDTPDTGGVNLNSLVKEITTIRQHQSNITADLKNLHRDNEIIWKEAIAAREKHQKHQQVISKILQFLTAVFSNEQHQLEGVREDMLSGQQFESRNHPFDQLQGITQEMQASHIDSMSLPDESETPHFANKASIDNSPEEVDPLECVEGKLDVNPPCAAMTLDAMNPTTAHFGLDTSKDKGKMRYDASRSAEEITQDIDELQGNVETLATQLGIDSTQFPLDKELNRHFANTSYSSMISSATENDKSRLFELAAGGNNKRPPLIHYNTAEGSSTAQLQYPTLNQQEFYSPYSYNVNNTFVPSPAAVGSYRDTNIIAEANVNKNTIYQSNSIPHVTNNNKEEPEKVKDKQHTLTNVEARRLFLSSFIANQQLQEQRYANLQQQQQQQQQFPPNFVRTQSYPIHPFSTFPQQQQEQTTTTTNNTNNNDLHHSFNNVHQLEQHISLMNSTNNNNSDADYTQQMAEASNFMNQNESKKEDRTIVY